MKKIFSFLASTLFVGTFAMPTYAMEKLLAQDELKELITGNSGRHWHLDHQRWYLFDWQSDGTLRVLDPEAKPDDEPVLAGTWRIKEFEAEKDDGPEPIKRANEALRHLYCQRFDHEGDTEVCFDMFQVTFNKVEDSDEEAPTQEYKCYRGGGAETGEFIITRRRPHIVGHQPHLL